MAYMKILGCEWSHGTNQMFLVVEDGWGQKYISQPLMFRNLRPTRCDEVAEIVSAPETTLTKLDVG
jgi:hypothetical protein